MNKYLSLFTLTTLLGLSTLVQAQPMLNNYNPNDGYIRINGRLTGDFTRFLNQGYPNAVNETVKPPERDCIPDGSFKKNDIQVLKHNLKSHVERQYPLAGEVSEEYVQRVNDAEIAKTELEDDLAHANTSFENLDDYFSSITDEPPKSCGYKLSHFTNAEVRAICKAMDDVANGRPAECHVSNCTTASYIGVIQIMRQRPDWESKKHLFTCSSPFPAAYLNFGNRGVRWFVHEYDLGESRRISTPGTVARKSQLLQESVAEGWPKKGDPLLMQRNASRGRTAHSVIFSHFETDDGQLYDPENPQQISKVCYWSSNQSTNGVSNRCETISYFDFFDAAHIKK